MAARKTAKNPPPTVTVQIELNPKKVRELVLSDIEDNFFEYLDPRVFEKSVKQAVAALMKDPEVLAEVKKMLVKELRSEYVVDHVHEALISDTTFQGMVNRLTMDAVSAITEKMG